MKYDSKKLNKWLRQNKPSLTWNYWTEIDRGFYKIMNLHNINLSKFEL